MRENEEKFRLIAENTSDKITVLVLDLNFTYMNPSVGKLREYTPEEVMKQKLEDILTLESVKKVMAIFKNNIHKVLAGVTEDYPIIELE